MEGLCCWQINGSQINILQYKVFLPILILIYSVCGINGYVTLSVDPAMSRGRRSFITCTTSNQITAGVRFLKDNAVPQGTCILPGLPCHSTISGYTVTQDVSTRTTTLSIYSVDCTRETGSWYCTHGSDSPSQTVNIGCSTTKYSPSINKSQFPSTYTVIAGRQLNINCASYTRPGRPSDTSYTWTHPDASTTSGSTLNINSMDNNQSGQFTCTASNIFSSTQQGQDSATVQVQVQFPPRVSGQDSSYPVVESSPLHINCSSYTIPGNPSTTSYRWTGPDSYTSTGPVLSISSINRTQTGQYTCTASNTLTPTGGPPQTGTGTGQFIVDVKYKPSISGFPDPYYVTENTNLQLDCSTFSQSNPAVTSYRWTGPGYSRDGAVLSISNINKDKTGQYMCTASNNIGTGIGQTTVNVQYKPSISGFPDPYYVTENTNLQLDCSTYSQSNPAVTSYRWTGPGYSRDGAVLSISNINKDKTGQYTCTASNILTPSGGSPLTGTGSSTLRVQVQYPASITSFTINSNTDTVTVSESDHVTIRCQMDINPGSTIRLLNGSSELSRADNSLTVEYTWTTNCRQRGKYECVTSNDIGNVTKSVRLSVTCAPKREVTSLQEQTAAVGDDTALSLTILSYPEPVITWLKTNSHRNLTSITSVSRASDVSVTASLTLTGVQQQDFGEYFVQADNGIGTAAIFSVRLLVAAQGGCDMEFGTGLGIGFGVCVPIIIIIISISIFLHRRRDALHKEEMKKTSDITAVNPPAGSTTGRVIYSTLDDDTPTPVYERINPEETTADREFNTNNEGSAHLYVN